MRTDGETDTRELIADFRQFASAPKMVLESQSKRSRIGYSGKILQKQLSVVVLHKAGIFLDKSGKLIRKI